MIRWSDGAVAVEDSVTGAPALSGEQLAGLYWQAMERLTLGLVRRRGDAAVIGPITLLRLGAPVIGERSVEWPIEGGLLAAAAGGRWSVRSEDGRVRASVTEFRPSLPRALYTLTHLQAHLLFTRLFLLSLRDREAAPAGGRASRSDRLRAASVDVALCLTLNRIFPRRARTLTAIGLLAGYHVACWSTSGRTLGGVVTGQRVVARDGRPLTVAQSVLRLVTVPLSWVTARSLHDEVAQTDVIADQKEEGAAHAAP